MAKVDPYGQVHYLFADRLGSAWAMTDAQGFYEQIWHYYPYGGKRLVYDTLTDPNTGWWKKNRHRFTGLWRDDETGLDHTLFRQYASHLGRWLTPDPIAGDFETPGSLNRYTYVLNNPTNFIDPLGLDESCPPGTSASFCVTVTATPPSIPLFYYYYGWTWDELNNLMGWSGDTAAWGGSSGGGAPKDPLDEAKERVGKALEEPDCARNFKDPQAVIKAIRNAKFRDLGPITEGEKFTWGKYYPWPASVFTGTKIALNSQVNWVNPTAQPTTGGGTVDLLGKEASNLGVQNVSPAQMMDLTLLHEAAHGWSKIGSPHDPRLERQLFNDCVK